MAFPSVAHPEEEPLGVTVSVNVVLQDQVVLVVAHFHRCKQVSSFKARFKDQGLVSDAIWAVKRSRRHLCTLFHIGWLGSLELVKVFGLTLDVVLLHELLNVNQVGGDLAHRLRQVWIVNQVHVLLC